jgi:hypothetical protein
MFQCWQRVVEILSGEWLLTKFKRTNGGAIILLRAVISSVLLYASSLLLMNWIDPGRTKHPSLTECRKEILDTLTWLGAMFAASYAALYARFAAQWSYLAGLYNQIKQAEAGNAGNEAAKKYVAEWKAGFLEDSEELHLERKRIFASVIHAWGKDEDVRNAYIRDTAGGEPRLTTLLKAVNEAHKYP